MAHRSEVLYQNFSNRLQPRLVFDSNSGSAKRTATTQGVFYTPWSKVQKVKRRLTEAEDNALARAARRRQHRFERGWLPHAKR